MTPGLCAVGEPIHDTDASAHLGIAGRRDDSLAGQRDRREADDQSARGCAGRIADRFDLTVECVCRHYECDTTHPLADAFGRYRDFFDLFGGFAGYVDFWILDDLVDADGGVKLFVPSENFALPSVRARGVLVDGVQLDTRTALTVCPWPPKLPAGSQEIMMGSER